MSKTTKFKGIINGKEYNSKEDYMKALKKIFNEEKTPITSISFDKEENYEDEDEPECSCCSCGCRDCKDESYVEGRYCDCTTLEDVREGLMKSEHLKTLLKNSNMKFEYLFPHFSNKNSPLFTMMTDPFSFDSEEMTACENSIGNADELTEDFKNKIISIIKKMTPEESKAYYRLVNDIIIKIKRTMIGINIHKKEVKNENSDLSYNFSNTIKRSDLIKNEIKRLQGEISNLEDEIAILEKTLNENLPENDLISKIEHNKQVLNHLNSFNNIMSKFNEFYGKINQVAYELQGERYPVCKLAGAPNKPYTLDKGDCGKDPATEAPVETSTREVKSQESVNINDLFNKIFEDPYMTGGEKVTKEDVKKMLECTKGLFKPLNKSIIPTEKDAKDFLELFFGKDK